MNVAQRRSIASTPLARLTKTTASGAWANCLRLSLAHVASPTAPWWPALALFRRLRWLRLLLLFLSKYSKNLLERILLLRLRLGLLLQPQQENPDRKSTR